MQAKINKNVKEYHMTLGNKIADLRKKNNMTQGELGERLHVTFQAVSKWERDESQPAFDTLCEIAKLFSVPIGYFSVDGESVGGEDGASSTLHNTMNAPDLLGICSQCGTAVKKGEAWSERPVLCMACHEDQEKKAREEKAAAIRKEKARRQDLLRQRNRGLIVGAIVAVIAAVVYCVTMVNSENPVSLIAPSIISVIVVFTFVSQLFWDGIVVNVTLAGGRVIGTPGVIFEFSFDGVIFLILVKLFFALLRGILYLLSLLFFVVVAMLISPFTFIPECRKLSRGQEATWLA